MKHYRIIEGEHDLPLPGPWSRRQGGTPQPQTNIPDRGGGEMEDKPLSGPWNRRGEGYGTPGGNVPGTAADPEYTGRDQIEDAPVPEPVRPRRRPVAAQRRADHGIDPVERPAVAVPLSPDAGAERPAAAQMETEPPAAPFPERPYESALLRSILSPRGIYAGIVMAEVLGSRGGRNGRQRPAFGRRYY